jgi:hypothetical protein
MRIVTDRATGIVSTSPSARPRKPPVGRSVVKRGLALGQGRRVARALFHQGGVLREEPLGDGGVEGGAGGEIEHVLVDHEVGRVPRVHGPERLVAHPDVVEPGGHRLRVEGEVLGALLHARVVHRRRVEALVLEEPHGGRAPAAAP